MTMFTITEDGKIFDRTTQQCIGISNQKKDEILTDYNSLCEENINLKSKLENFVEVLEANSQYLPEAVLKLIEKPPTVESLQHELLEVKNMMAILLTNLNRKDGVANDNSSTMPKSRPKQSDTKSGTADASVNAN